MAFLVLRAYLMLIHFDFYLARNNFASLHGKVKTFPVCKPIEVPGITKEICAAVDMASIWYWKEVLCLQRSAVTTCLLKRYGVPAQMVIGAQQMPLKAHAWVEVSGLVVNDKSYVREIYAVLDEC